ncbi:MAG: hypothetical protein NWS78_04100 [Gammaproteobacteria bacterium]|nr:hypothetical protein [Gammaproteobacteria bacterium]
MTKNPDNTATGETTQPEVGAKPKKIVREEIKDRHTSHWDMDMMSREELEAFMTQRPDSNPD